MRSTIPNATKCTISIDGHIGVRISGYLSKLWQRSQREVASDALIEGAVYATADPSDGIAQTEISLALASVHERLTEYPATKTKDFARLLADLVEQLQTTGKVSYTEIAKKYGYSRQAASEQVKDLLKTDPMLE